jgi:zinc protease
VSLVPGPRGALVACETARDVPLCWFEITARGGAVGDPEGQEGLTWHMTDLARRGAGRRSRAEIDRELDDLGANLDVTTGRDSFSLHGVCLTTHLEATLAIVADVLAAPTMSEAEHEKLRREAGFALDELRDDDASLAVRFFNRFACPGHPYARAALGTAESLAALRLEDARTAYRRAVVPTNLIVGFAGDLDEDTGVRLARRLVERLPEEPAPPLPDVTGPPPPTGRRTVLVDKPERSQTQIAIGHIGPPPGGDDYVALSLVQTIFGGTFTSRLMQEIRVQRGWSYGAGFRLGHTRGPHWLRIELAPAAEVTPNALAHTLALYETLAEDGVTAAELAFAQAYWTGHWRFLRATARDRMRLTMDRVVRDLPADYLERLPARLAAVTLADTRQAIDRWVRPADALCVLVATADELGDKLDPAVTGPLEIHAYDSY